FEKPSKAHMTNGRAPVPDRIKPKRVKNLPTPVVRSPAGHLSFTCRNA
ncbi:hypothetical protein V3C99_015171, partial [Haemonchus contortus]